MFRQKTYTHLIVGTAEQPYEVIGSFDCIGSMVPRLKVHCFGLLELLHFSRYGQDPQGILFVAWGYIGCLSLESLLQAMVSAC